MEQTLRFFARGTALVVDVHAQEHGLRRFVGREYRQVAPGQWGFVPTGKVQEIDHHHDLVRACMDGDLLPADEATASACGVDWKAVSDEVSKATTKPKPAQASGGDKETGK